MQKKVITPSGNNLFGKTPDVVNPISENNMIFPLSIPRPAEENQTREELNQANHRRASL